MLMWIRILANCCCTCTYFEFIEIHSGIVSSGHGIVLVITAAFLVVVVVVVVLLLLLLLLLLLRLAT